MKNHYYAVRKIIKGAQYLCYDLWQQKYASNENRQSFKSTFIIYKQETQIMHVVQFMNTFKHEEDIVAF